MTVSFLIPIYSEVDSVRRTVEILGETCGDLEYEILLLVHKRSSAECRALCGALAREYPSVRLHYQKRYPGQGFAYREGFELARGTHFVMMNADLETDPRDARRLIDAMHEKKGDLIVASRFMRGGRLDAASYGRVQALITVTFQRLIGLLAKSPIHDLTFSYKIGSRELFESFAWEGEGHELSMETTLRPILAGYRVSEIPTTWIGRGEGASNHSYLRNLRHLRLAARLLVRRTIGQHV